MMTAGLDSLLASCDKSAMQGCRQQRCFLVAGLLALAWGAELSACRDRHGADGSGGQSGDEWSRPKHDWPVTGGIAAEVTS
ncbi:MAG TPA: hypothetical protein VG963_14800 [Polyangiaceae bacterium]|nr:hypothetical protein [Polyangiaceae bacterium]